MRSHLLLYGEQNNSRKSEVVINKLNSREAVLSNGETVPVDIIICGTGCHQICPFLEDDVMQKVTSKEGDFRLYRSIQTLSYGAAINLGCLF